MSELLLRAPRASDADTYRQAHAAMVPDAFPFAFGYDPDMDFADYLAALDHIYALDAPVGDTVPAAFLLAEVDGEVVGRSSIRFGLNDFLRAEAGHIGYCVLPDHRRRGYATEILKQSVPIAKARGVDEILITCDESNVASARVIEVNGGVYESSVPSVDSDELKRRYWIR